MSGIEVKEDNTDEVVSALSEAIEAALTEIGMTVETQAKALCPVGTPESTGIPGYIGGTLRNSITFEIEDDEKAVYIGTNVEYGKYVELGTSKWDGKPFLRPAIEYSQGQIQAILNSRFGA